MSAERFLELAEEGGFLEAKTVQKLRKHLADSSRDIPPDELAELLVSRKLLTAEESRILLQAEFAPDGEQPAPEDDFDRPAQRESDTWKSLDVIDDPSDENITLLAADPVPPSSGLMDDGPLSNDGGGKPATSEPIPNLPPIDADHAIPAAPRLDTYLNDHTDVGPPSGAIATVRQFFRRKKTKGQPWDSSLMLIGGGGLLLLILAGGALYFVLTVGSGDEVFQLAQDDYKSQLYTQAIVKYDRFINRFPRHNKVSLARVRGGLAHMRGDVESGNWDSALRTVQTRLEQIRTESDFPVARPELAGILPDIYAGFVERAEEAKTADGKEMLLARASETYQLISNPDYLPSSQRQQIESRVNRIQQRAGKVQRDIGRQREIAAAVANMDQAVADGDSALAYRLRNELIEQYPGAQKNQRFQAAVMNITNAEQRSVRVSDEDIVAQTAERPKPTVRKVAMSARRFGDAEQLDGHILYTLARGGLYAIEGRTGKLLWRRWIGFQSDTSPIALDPNRGGDAFVIDHRHGDLIRLHATTGQLQWRADIGETQTAPVVWGDNLLQGNQSGKLFLIDAADGAIRRTATFPQALTAAPGIDRHDHLLFQPGNHSTLYVLDADTFQCIDAVFIGHSDGTITVAPTVTKEHVLVIENGATDYCRLHVLARGRQGTLQKAGQPLRLRGIVVDPPITYGRNVLIATDHGAVYVLEMDAANVREPVRIFAQVHPRNQRTSDHFGLLSNDRILISGTGLSEYEIDSARGELSRLWTEHLEDIHLAAPELVGDTLVTRRRTPTAGEVIVEASRIPPADTQNDVPTPIWTTRIAAAPVGSPLIMPAQRQFLVTACYGATWAVDMSSFRDGVMERPWNDSSFPVAAVIPMGSSPMEETGVVFAAADDRARWKYAAPGGLDAKTVRLNAVQQRISTTPVRFADGLLLCSTTGPIHYAAADTGELLAEPYQPLLRRGSSVRWLRPAVKGQVAWVASEDGLLQRIELDADGLVAKMSADLQIELTSAPAVTGNTLYVVARTGKGDAVIAISTESLEVIQKWPMTSRITTGPMAVADRAVFITADDRWMMFADGAEGQPQPQWESELPQDMLAGAPILQDGTWICATQRGELFRVDPATGSVLPWSGDATSIALGEPLGSGVVITNRLLLVAGHDGTLYATPLPEAPE
jgi:outer membrane protein assembly factor BamB